MTIRKILLAALLTISLSNLTANAAGVEAKSSSKSPKERIAEIQKKWEGSTARTWLKLKVGSKAGTGDRLQALFENAGVEIHEDAVKSLTKALETNGVQTFYVSTTTQDGKDAGVTKLRTVTAVELVTELANPSPNDQGKSIRNIRAEKISKSSWDNVHGHYGAE